MSFELLPYIALGPSVLARSFIAAQETIRTPVPFPEQLPPSEQDEGPISRTWPEPDIRLNRI